MNANVCVTALLFIFLYKHIAFISNLATRFLLIIYLTAKSNLKTFNQQNKLKTEVERYKHEALSVKI